MVLTAQGYIKVQILRILLEQGLLVEMVLVLMQVAAVQVQAETELMHTHQEDHIMVEQVVQE